MKKKNEYLPEDEERSKEGKRVEDATNSKTEAKSSVNSEHRCILSALLSMTCNVTCILIYALGERIRCSCASEV